MNLPGIFKLKTAGKATDNINGKSNGRWKGRYVVFCRCVKGRTADTSSNTHRRMWGHSGGRFGFAHIWHAEGQQTKPVEDRTVSSDFDHCVEFCVIIFPVICCGGFWPDLAACQGQDVVGVLRVDATAAAPRGELLLGAHQQPQQHLKRTGDHLSTRMCCHALHRLACSKRRRRGPTYRGPLGQTVQIGV